MYGRVSRYFADRGYGWLVSEENGQEYFFHQNDLPDGTVPPRKGTRITFELGKNQTGPKAVNVVVVPTPSYLDKPATSEVIAPSKLEVE